VHRLSLATRSSKLETIMPDATILGIESSCDETAAAVVRSGRQILSSVVASQISTHRPYGGIVPELASREHLRAIIPVVRQALRDAGHSYQSIDAIAVTQGPGLAGALLVGISFAKALSFALDKPLIAVNHLEGHIHAVLLEHRHVASRPADRSADEPGSNEDLQFPVLALVVSGGHTHLYLAKSSAAPQSLTSRDQLDEDLWIYDNIGHTRDDAAGEAFDKVAKLLGLGYPGGPVIDLLAPYGDAHAVKFQLAQIKHPDRRKLPQLDRASGSGPAERFDFSYSGIKTAVLRYVETEGMKPHIETRREALASLTANANSLPTLDDYLRLCDRLTLNLIASFQRAMVNDLVTKTLAAARAYDAGTLFVSGGVAANKELRATFQQQAEMQGLPVFFPSRKLSTDNAAMIAAAAFPKFASGQFVAMDFSAEAGLALR
jgi:N6-L-threonylcarbamoyladenine synthase